MTDKSFFRLPAIVRVKGEEVRKLTERRRRAWISAINRKDLKESNLKYARVCSDHFISGNLLLRKTKRIRTGFLVKTWDIRRGMLGRENGTNGHSEGVKRDSDQKKTTKLSDGSTSADHIAADDNSAVGVLVQTDMSSEDVERLQKQLHCLQEELTAFLFQSGSLLEKKIS